MSENDQKLLQPYSVSRAVYRCDSTERKMLYYAAVQVQHKPFVWNERKYKGYLAEFKISEMLLALGMTNTDTNRKRIRNAVETIAEKPIKVVDTEKKLEVLPWLRRGTYDEEKNIVQLVFTEEIGELFVECKERFSLIKLKIIGGLKSYYAMRYYEIALSYRGYMGKCENPIETWYFERSIDDLRMIFKIDKKSYDHKGGTKDFIEKVVKQPIAELNKLNSDFTITVEKLKNPLDRRRVVGFKFTCNVCKVAETTAKTELATKSASTKQKETEDLKLQEEIPEKIPEKKQEQERTKGLERELVDLKDQNAVLAEGNELLSKMTKLQMKYPKEFYERLTERQKKRKPFDFDILIFKEIVDSMIADGFF